MGECYKMSEKNQQLEKLVHCLTSMLAIQGCGYREIPGPENSPNFKKESMMVMRKMLAESLKALGAYSNGFDQTLLRKKPIMGIPPMINNGNILDAEDSKEQEKDQLKYPNDFDDNKDSIFGPMESSIPPSPKLTLNSPKAPSVPLSPLLSVHQDPGMNVDPLPNYFFHADMNQPENNPSKFVNPAGMQIQEYRPYQYDLFEHGLLTNSQNAQEMYFVNNKLNFNRTPNGSKKRECAEVETLSNHSEGRRTPEPNQNLR